MLGHYEYKHLFSAVKKVLENNSIQVIRIGQTASNQFEGTEKQYISIHQTPSDELEHISIPAEKLLTNLSYSYLQELASITNLTKRTFLEIEAINNTWSVKELKRQINTLYYERSGISKKPNQLSIIVNQRAERFRVEDMIKSPFSFEFLGFKAKDVVYENDLEKALLDRLEDFLLEMGNGFCFEAKQKSILIGDEYFFIDLVFYHRVLKCHVLVELKVDKAKHEYIGQLKTYVNYYKKEIMQEDDNPPVGLLLVTNQNRALVEYAIADSDQQLFVSKYLLELPSEEELIAEIEREKNVLREQGVVYGMEE